MNRYVNLRTYLTTSYSATLTCEKMRRRKIKKRKKRKVEKSDFELTGLRRAQRILFFVSGWKHI